MYLQIAPYLLTIVVLAAFFGKTVMAAVIGIVVTIVVAAIVSYVLGIDVKKEDAKLAVTEPVQQTVSDDAILALADGS